jgi:hypothetical protein
MPDSSSAGAGSEYAARVLEGEVEIFPRKPTSNTLLTRSIQTDELMKKI